MPFAIADKTFNKPISHRIRSTSGSTSLAILVALGLVLPGCGSKPVDTSSHSRPPLEKIEAVTITEPSHAEPDVEEADGSKIHLDEAIIAGTNEYEIYGRCVEAVVRGNLPGIKVHLYKIDGWTKPPAKLASVVTNAKGQFEFSGLIPAREYDQINPLTYLLVADKPDWAYALLSSSMQDEDGNYWRLYIYRAHTTISGKVVDTDGRPVVGATVSEWEQDGRMLPGIWTGVTDENGHFEITHVADEEWKRNRRKSKHGGIAFPLYVSHPDFPFTYSSYHSLPGTVEVVLERGCEIVGTAVTKDSNQPASGMVVAARPLVHPEHLIHAVTDSSGRFRLVVPEEKYDFVTLGTEHVAPAIGERECKAGERVILPTMKTVMPAKISANVVDIETKETIIDTYYDDRPFSITAHSPNDPPNFLRQAENDSWGKIELWVPPGLNQLEFTESLCMRDRKPVPETIDLKPGQHEEMELFYIPPPSYEEQHRQMAAQRNAEFTTLPQETDARVREILRRLFPADEKVSNTSHELGRGFYLRELIQLGPKAVPQICDALDHASDGGNIAILAFSLRAIGDLRAAPALIRALPKTNRWSSPYFSPSEPELKAFFEKYYLPSEQRTSFNSDINEAKTEILAGWRQLTGENWDAVVIEKLMPKHDPRRRALLQRLFNEEALRWAKWWDTNGHRLVDDPAYAKANLVVNDVVIPPFEPLRPEFKAYHDSRTVLAPPDQSDRQGQDGKKWPTLLDIDTWATYHWPKDFPNDPANVGSQQLAAWAKDHGVDVMCIAQKMPDGSLRLILRSFDLEAWEISEQDDRDKHSYHTDGELPKGRAMGEILLPEMSWIDKSSPETRVSSIRYRTREGNVGVLSISESIASPISDAKSNSSPRAEHGLHVTDLPFYSFPEDDPLDSPESDSQ